MTRLPRALTALLAGLVLATPVQGYAEAGTLAPGYVDPYATATLGGPAYALLARRPTVRWVTSSTPQVRQTVADYVDGAAAVHRTPELALYAIPARDCGDYSAGGLPSAAAYRAWIRLVAAGVDGVRTLIVLEPDALPQLGACPGQGARQVLHALRGLGVRGVHYVMDTSRNGAHPAPAGSDWCNPVRARIGAAPRLVPRGAFDGRLWVKHPGESDGPCHGGPVAGAWCDLLADRLLGRDPAEGRC